MDKEDIIEHNRKWYKKTYDLLINKATSEEFQNNIISNGLIYHTHHIIPKCLGGTDDEFNLVKLPIRWHIIAHLLLSKIYSNEPKLITAAFLMVTEWSPKTNKRERVSTRTIAAIKEEFIKTQVGKEYSDEDRKKFSSEMTEEKKFKISETLKTRGKLNNTNSRCVMAEGIEYEDVKSCAVVYGVCSSLVCRWMKDESKPEFYYLTGPARKKAKGPDGTIYNSIREASKQLGRTRDAIRNWINNYPHMGFSFVD